MFVILALVTGGLYAAAFYLLLQRNIMRLIFGLVLLGHAANLLIFTVARLRRAAPALVLEGETAPPPGFADPLPQALILTAIVISFAVTAFAAVLVRRVYEEVGTEDSDQMRATDT